MLNFKKQLSSEQFNLVSHIPTLDTADTLEECGEYALMESIQGRVCKAVHKSKKHMIAIKQISLKANYNPILLEILQNELLLYRSLSHTNIVQYISHILENPEKLAIATEYLECKSARELLDGNMKFSESLVALITHQILLGLKYLQEQGVVHGNLTASNVLVCADGGVKLVNFGVVSLLKEIALIDEKHYFRSTAYWMAPESILMEGSTTAVDVWALGCVIIELLNGAPPFYQYSPPMAMYHIVGDLPLPIPLNISLRLRDFLLKCLQRDIDLRASVESLLEDPWITHHLDRLGKNEITKEIRWSVFDQYGKDNDPSLKLKRRIMTPKRSDRGVNILAARENRDSPLKPSYRYHSITHSLSQPSENAKREMNVSGTQSGFKLERSQASPSTQPGVRQIRRRSSQRSLKSGGGSSIIARSYVHLPPASVSLEAPNCVLPYKLSYTPKQLQSRKKKSGPGRKLRKAIAKGGHPLSQEETDKIIKQFFDVPESCEQIAQWAVTLNKLVKSNFAIGAILLANGFFEIVFEVFDSLKTTKDSMLGVAVNPLFQLLYTFMEKQDSVQSDFCLAGGVSVLVEWVSVPSVRVDLLRLIRQLLGSKNSIVLNSLLSCRIPKHLVNYCSTLSTNSEVTELVISCLIQLMKAVDDPEVFGNLIRTKKLLVEFSNLLMELWKSDNHQATLDVADLMVFYFQTCENLLESFQITSNKDKSSACCSVVMDSLPFKTLMKIIGSVELQASDLGTLKCTCHIALTVKILSMIVYLSIHPVFRGPLLSYGVPQKLVYFISLHHLRDKLLDASGASYIDELIHKSLVVLTYLCQVNQNVQEVVLNVGIVKELVTVYKLFRHYEKPGEIATSFPGAQSYRTLVIRIICLFPNNSAGARAVLWRSNIFKYYVSFLRDARYFHFGLKALSLWLREEPDKVANEFLASENALKRLMGVLAFPWSQQMNDSFLSICRDPKIITRLCSASVLDSIANILKKNPAASTKLKFLQFLSALAQAAPPTYAALGAFAKIQQLITQFTLDQSLLICQTATKLVQDIHQARSKINIGPATGVPCALSPPKSFLPSP